MLDLQVQPSIAAGRRRVHVAASVTNSGSTAVEARLSASGADEAVLASITPGRTSGTGSATCFMSSAAFAMPKSATFPRPPFAISAFSGSRSRCTIPALPAKSIAASRSSSTRAVCGRLSSPISGRSERP